MLKKTSVSLDKQKHRLSTKAPIITDQHSYVSSIFFVVVVVVFLFYIVFPDY